MRRAILVAVVCLTGAGAHAENSIDFVDGNKLYEFCQDPVGNYCTGYVAGVAATSDRYGYTFCLPNGVKDNQLSDVVSMWLRDHPEKRHKAAGFLVVEAMKEKFPCN